MIRSRLGGLSGGRIDVEVTNKRRRSRDQSYSGSLRDSFPLILLAVICATRMTAWPVANQKAKVCNRSKQGCNAAVQFLHDYPLSECRARQGGFLFLFFVALSGKVLPRGAVIWASPSLEFEAKIHKLNGPRSRAVW